MMKVLGKKLTWSLSILLWSFTSLHTQSFLEQRGDQLPPAVGESTKKNKFFYTA